MNNNPLRPLELGKIKEKVKVVGLTKDGKDRHAAIVARKVVDLIQEGKTPTEAATIAGLPPEAIAGSPSLQKQISDLLAEAYMGPELQRATLRAGRFKAFVQMLSKGLECNDTALLKVAAEFSKQIAMDPEIGLSQPPQQVVNIDIGELKDVLKNTEPLEGFEKPVWDVEVQDENS